MYNKEYSVGLDIGTTSVGFSAIDKDYKPIKLKGKTVIGANLFKEGETAAERRGYRTTRRRLKRRKWRLALLEEIFDPYMAEVDPTFFARLKESNLSPKDSRKQFTNSLLFPKRTDSSFYEDFPTIYHLRNHLMKGKEKSDLREIFLAIHHIVKYRGNFLYNMSVDDFNTDSVDFSQDFSAVNEAYLQLDPIKLFQLNKDNIEEVSHNLLDNGMSNLDKQKTIAKLLFVKSEDREANKANNIIVKQISKAMLGYKFDLASVLKVITEDKSKWKISFGAENIDEVLEDLITDLNEQQLEILNILLKLHSQIALNDIVPSGITLSKSMIQKYNDHKEHLKILKKYAKSLNRESYRKIMDAYAAYIGNDSVKKATQEDFYKAIKRQLNDSELASEINELIANNKFMPKQRTNQNGVIPYQLHLKELNQIIKNQSQYYPWLAELNPNKARRRKAKYKIGELVAFRIPYYVGPLITEEDQQKTSDADFAWMIRKGEGKITPWNFDEKVDRMASANKFIKRMTTKDTYLLGESVLPDHSLLYERYKVLSELNIVRVNGHRLNIGLKQDIYHDLFEKHKRVTKKQLVNYLESKGFPANPIISGLSDPARFNSSLATFIDFRTIFGSKINDPDKFEKIIEWITIFEDKKILKEKISEEKWISDSQITELLAKQYRGWGRLSMKLLSEFKDQNGNSIIDLMWNSSKTFMEIINEPVFAEQIKNENQDQLKEEDYKSILDDAYTSPQNKKAIRQVIKVVDDIVSAAGKAPKFISIEFAREDQSSRRTQSRLTQLKRIYESTAKELVQNERVRKEFGNIKDLDDRLYLYFTQLGRDMYTGEIINIDEISSRYDIDHILPQAFIKDDSLDNKVLVSRAINNGKSNNVPLNLFGNKMKPFWDKLKDHRLISKRKYEHLITNPDTIDKYRANGFINRQLVETRQVIKLAANILSSRYSDAGTQIIEVKANLNHQMRKSFNLYKNREVNDYHHAVDGYLSAFVGQYLYNRYPALQSYFVYGKYQRFFDQRVKTNLKFNHFNFLYDLTSSDQETIVNKSTGEIIGKQSELISQIKRVYGLKYMLISQETYTNSGAMFDQTIYPAKSNKTLIPIKSGKPIQIYGGYSGNKDAYMSIIRIKGKKEDKLKVVGVPMRALTRLNKLKKQDYDSYLEGLYRVLAETTAKVQTNRRNGQKKKEYLQFDIVIPKINYRQLIIDGQLKYTLGSSTYQYNARQLVLSNNSVKILATDFTKSSDTIEEQNEQLMYVYDEILNKINQYLPLYDKNKFRTGLKKGRDKFEALPVLPVYDGAAKKGEGKVEVLRNILMGLHDDPATGNLKSIGIKTPFGMLQSPKGILISKNAKLIYDSPSALFQRELRVSDLIK
ncbi:type II CRISPR RNA-guided endonuclease Cas9 [uncultured Limosilactobacillus sp.]|uniref:type II CRISPR RNA-guided endonuclease Cas9 n=1 Tax=uncultured Limosilactobacillus sp. TaxID=2837629 RepID=UPI0025D3FB33|nr:type II CRISPR RNA-guided endonuclease Cas9 [uncultured Limosilactobacillus sp.]